MTAGTLSAADHYRSPSNANALPHATEDNAALRHHTASLEEVLAARTSLRRMIRDENLNQ
ncbi:hypothetical protein ACIP2Y_44600 [Streptomyces sviceus]|uniref:hypothetical protein n=1 Tax=Streptomyces sviceus TaxID=285530 RepID=UPI0038034599